MTSLTLPRVNFALSLNFPISRRFPLAACAALSLLALSLSPACAGTTVVRIDPAISHGTWEGWGTSLCWYGKTFGNRDDLADLVFTTKMVTLAGHDLPGLGMNIARYNAGACSWNEVDGRKMAVSKKMWTYAQMEGFWLDGKSADPHSASWNWTVDANQRALLLEAQARGANRFELFSNSPMWWMCKNDNPSGATDAKVNNLAPEDEAKFATYLATIAKYAKDNWGLTFTSVEPFNEPSSDYWYAQNKQEGCHFSPKMQAEVFTAPAREDG
jgi:galactan endo-1,6-beta-galactosidase